MLQTHTSVTFCYNAIKKETSWAKRPSLASAILYREVQGSSYRFAVMSGIIKRTKNQKKKKARKKNQPENKQTKSQQQQQQNPPTNKNLHYGWFKREMESNLEWWCHTYSKKLTKTGNLVQSQWGSPHLEGLSCQLKHHKHPKSQRTNHTFSEYHPHPLNCLSWGHLPINVIPLSCLRTYPTERYGHCRAKRIL